MTETWTRYRVVWQLDSPLHIGYQTIGMIHRTRIWVQGRNVWAGIVEAIAMASGGGNLDYTQSQEGINATLRFEAGFLSYSPANSCMPKYHNEQEGSKDLEGRKRGLHFGEYTEAEWQRSVLAARVSTALERGVAAEGQLFEFEYIAPALLQPLAEFHAGSPLYLHIHIWANDGGALLKQCQHIQIGGERNKGFGWLSQRGPIQPAMTASEPRLTLSPNSGIPLFVQVNSELHAIRGMQVPVVGRSTITNQTYGQRVEQAKICWLPGSVWKEALTLSFSDTTPGVAIIMN